MKKIKPASQFVLCIRSEGNEDLEPRKVYQVVPDPKAKTEGFLRIIDDSGEDYLYPAEYFVPIEVPKEAAKVLAVA